MSREIFEFILAAVRRFPFYGRWDDIVLNKKLCLWNEQCADMHNFLLKYEGHEPVKHYNFHSNPKKISIIRFHFPAGYSSGADIALRDIAGERAGVKFAAIIMKSIIDIQLES